MHSTRAHSLFCLQRLEYADCISCKGLRPLSKKDVLGVTLNCIWGETPFLEFVSD